MPAAPHPTRVAPRWPAALTVIALLVVLSFMGGRVRLLPAWYPFMIAAVLLLPMLGTSLAAGRRVWRIIERTCILLACASVVLMGFVTVLFLIRQMLIDPNEFSGRQLLLTSVSAWLINLVMFALAYWQTDRGGPDARVNGEGGVHDFLFPQTGIPEEIAPGWQPGFVDYLFLAFTTSTAFSPTDVLPLTSRAKLMMMCQIAISLSTLVVVASRAINMLGG